MDPKLFSRHITHLKNVQDEKNILIEKIYKETNVLLDDKEILLSKKEISLRISSVKRMILNSKKLGDIVKKEGYVLK